MRTRIVLFSVFIIAITLFSPTHIYANRGKISILEELKVTMIDISDNSKEKPEIPDKWIRHNKMLTKMKNNFKSNIQDIAYRIGNNQHLEIDQNTPNTMKNFILEFMFTCIPQETHIPLEGVKYKEVKAAYSFQLHITLHDPHTNIIIGVYQVSSQYTSSDPLSAEEQAELASKLFSSPNMPKIDQVEEDIIRAADYRSAKISYVGSSIANGSNRGKIQIKNIAKRLVGEARNNPISSFILRCEKGKFLKTNSKEIRFEGNEYFHHNNLEIEFDYQNYNCNDYENEKEFDRFTLIQESRFNANIPQKVVQTEEIPFSCGGYDVYAHYYCEGFAEAEVVWRNVNIVIPNDKSEIKLIDASTFEEDDNPKVGIPYGVIIPNYGKEYFFSECESETETPEVIKMNSLAGGISFLDTSEDALNSFSIEMTPETPNTIKVVLQFDMYVGETRENSQQMTVGTDSEYPGGTEFYWPKIDDVITKKLQAGEYAQQVLTNQGGGKLTITFKPISLVTH